MVKFIVHLGAGKTGTSSIQKTLLQNDKLLKENGVWYLGLMLERSNINKFEWQKQSTVIPEFYKLTEDEVKEQLLEILMPTIKKAKEDKLHTLIWSNESLLGRKYGIINALLVLKEQGVEVEIVYYVREYTSWARSAYIQWGLKDKTYEGKLRTFEEFSKHRFPSFYNSIKNFHELMPETLKVRNMSVIRDVVADFLEISNINFKNLEIFRDNDTITSEELLLRAKFNALFNGKVLPRQFDNIVGRNISFSKTPEEYLNYYMPTEQNLKNILMKNSDDISSINLLLKNQGQEIFDVKKISKKDMKIDSDKLLMSLIDIVLLQSQKISKLTKLLKDIEGKIE